MPIFVRKSYDPGTRYAKEGGPAILARNAVYDELKRLVKRYVLEEVSGRSYLISGHRGSGKTTLIKKIVDDVSREVVAEGKPRRPLLVTLQGPMLLPALDQGRSATVVDETTQFLQQAVLKLYRELAVEVADKYEDTVRTGSWQSRRDRRSQWLYRLRSTAGGYYELQEIARDLRLKLDGPIDLAELREYWRAIGALDEGILFPQFHQTSQGLNELTAVWSCLRAYLTLASSEFELTAKDRNQQEAKAEASVKTAEGKSLLPALFGLAGGSAIAALLQQATHNPAAAALWGVAGGVGGALLLSYSASRSRNTTSSLESSVTIKRDMQSLARELPELLQRCRRAGLVPVFLVDELDKVEKLETRMEMLVRNTKFFVTEQALFFFATDRSYYECLRSSARSGAYPRAYTFFSDQLFVAYRPENWRAYLRERLVAVSQPDDPDDPADNAREVLIAVLLCRSRMHAIDLQRRLAEVSGDVTGVREDAEAQIEIPATELLNRRGFQLEVLMQCAVEQTLAADRDLADRCRQDPAFTQIACDALYYLRHLWQTPVKPVRMVKSDFAEYLNNRSEPLFEDEDDPDLEHLFLRAKEVVFWLCNPKQLAEAAAPAFHKAMVDRVDGAPPLLLAAADGYHWQYDPFGRALSPVKLQEVRDDADLRHRREMIRAVNKALRQNAEKVAGLTAMQKAGLLPITPVVGEIFDALDRLDRLDQEDAQAYDRMDEDVQSVRFFGGVLRDRGVSLARAAVSGWLLARYSINGMNADGYQAAWNCLELRLCPGELAPPALMQLADSVYYTLNQTWANSDFPLKPVSLDQYEHEAWSTNLAAKVKEIRTSAPDQKDWKAIAATARQHLANRITQHLKGTPIAVDDMKAFAREEMFCWVGNIDPERWLAPNLAKVSIRGWSRTLYLAIMQTKGIENIVVPVWLGVTAALMLSFKELAADLMDRADTTSETPADLARQFNGAVKRVLAAREESAGMLKSLAALAPDFFRQDALILCGEESVAALWTPSSLHPCVAFTAQELLGLKQGSPPLRPLEAPGKVAFILIEIGQPDGIERTSHMDVPQLLKEFNLLDYYDTERTKVGILVSTAVTDVGTQLRYLYQCTGVDDAISRLLTPIIPAG